MLQKVCEMLLKYTTMVTPDKDNILIQRFDFI